MDFNTWKEFYNWGFCTKEQLQEAVDGGMLTKAQYDEILGIQELAPTPTKGEGTAETKPVENTKTETQETKSEPEAKPIVNETPVAQPQATTPITNTNAN